MQVKPRQQKDLSHVCLEGAHRGASVLATPATCTPFSSYHTVIVQPQEITYCDEVWYMAYQPPYYTIYNTYSITKSCQTTSSRWSKVTWYSMVCLCSHISPGLYTDPAGPVWHKLFAVMTGYYLSLSVLYTHVLCHKQER